MQSKLESFSDSQLKKYMKFVLNVIGNDTPDSLADFYQFEKLNSIFIPVNKDFSRLDIEYVYYLLKNNENFENEIDRPELEEKGVTLEVEERQWVTIQYSANLVTYAPEDMDSSYLDVIREEGEIDPFDWDDDSDVEDSEWIDERWYIDEY